MPNCMKSHLVFLNFLGEAPQTHHWRSRFRRSVWGFAPLPGPPFQNSWMHPCRWLSFLSLAAYSIVEFHNLHVSASELQYCLKPDLLSYVVAINKNSGNIPHETNASQPCICTPNRHSSQTNKSKGFMHITML